MRALPSPCRRATIDVFGLVALAIFGLIAAVLLIRFTGLTTGALGETHAAKNINEIVVGARKACRDGEAVVSAFTVPEQYAYVVRTCNLWECTDGNCQDETIAGHNWPLDADSKRKVFDKFCNGRDSQNLLAACYIIYGVHHDWGPLGQLMGWKRIVAQTRKCENIHCGISYDINLIMPGKQKYRMNIVRDGETLVGRKYDA